MFSETKLKQTINEWLNTQSIAPGLSDWREDPVFRLKVYGEFQQELYFDMEYSKLHFISSEFKKKAEDNICLILSEDFQNSVFAERVDQIERALKNEFRSLMISHTARESRWPKTFNATPPPVVVERYIPRCGLNYDQYMYDQNH